VQYKMGNTWLLYQDYADQGYTQSKTHTIDAERSVPIPYTNACAFFFKQEKL
jgi:hypothetical protein